MPTVPPTVVVIGWTLPEATAGFPGAGVVQVEHIDQLEAAVASAPRGGVVVVPDQPDLVDAVVADLRRLGPIRVVRDRPDSRPPSLPGQAQAVLALLAEGLSLGAAADRLGLSRRTADRRLAEARRALGVSTTAEALVATRRPPEEGRSALGQAEEPLLLGRDDELHQICRLLAEDGAALVVGDGGVGKSAVLGAALSAAARPARTATALAVMRLRRLWPLSQALGVTLDGDIDAVAAQVEAVVGPDLLVVDDVHLSDASTVDVLASLVGRVALLVAARPSTEDDDVAARLTGAGFTLVPVDPLPEPTTTALARALAPELTASRLREVVAGSSGLPLLVEFLCGRDPEAPLGRGLVPALSGLSRPARDAALRLALSASPMSPDAYTDALVAAGVATRRSDDTVAIRHALVGDAVIAAATPEAITQAHRDLARAAVDRGVAAQHWQAAGDLVRAGDAALAAAATTGSASDRALLLALAARCAPTEQRNRRLLDAAAALSDSGLHQEVLELLDDAEIHVAEPAVLAHVMLLRARALWHQGESAQALDRARAGLAAIEGCARPADAYVEAALLVEAVRAEALSVGVRDGHDVALRRAADLIGDGSGKAALLSVVGIVQYLRDGSVAAWEEGRRVAAAEGDVDSFMRCSNNVIMWHESVGEPQTGIALALQAAADADQRGLVEWRSQFQAMAANLLYHAGRHREALPLLETVESVALDTRTRRQARVCRVSILIDLGLLDAATTLVPPLPPPDAPDWMHDDSVTYLHAALAQALGRPQDALTISHRLANRPNTSGDILAFLQPVRAWAEYDLGLPVTAPTTFSDLPVIAGLVREAEGVLHLRDDPATAADLLTQAADAGSGRTFGPSLRARWGAAEAHRRAGSADAVDRLLAVEMQVAEAGYEPLLARVHRSLRLAGVPRASRRAMDRSGLLTVREREVLDLVAGGASYEQAARRLGVGRPTVRRLLDNARGKLGVSSRLGAVAAVAEATAG